MIKDFGAILLCIGIVFGCQFYHLQSNIQPVQSETWVETIEDDEIVNMYTAFDNNDVKDWLSEHLQIKAIRRSVEANFISYEFTTKNATAYLEKKDNRVELCELSKLLSQAYTNQEIMLILLNDNDYEHILIMINNGDIEFYWRGSQRL